MSTFEIWQLIIGSGLVAGFIKFIYATGQTNAKIDTILEKLDSISSDISEIKKDIRSIDTRLSRLEGAFYERGYWESRYTGTEKPQ